MRLLTAVFGFASVFMLCNLICIFMLRAVGVVLPLSFLFHFNEQRERDLITSLQGRSKRAYIFVSGFLLFTCPLFLGTLAYDRLARIQSNMDYYVGTANYVVGPAIFLLVLAWGGVSLGNRIWRKAQR